MVSENSLAEKEKTCCLLFQFSNEQRLRVWAIKSISIVLHVPADFDTVVNFDSPEVQLLFQQVWKSSTGFTPYYYYYYFLLINVTTRPFLVFFYEYIFYNRLATDKTIKLRFSFIFFGSIGI